MPRIIVTVNPVELDALVELALKELRSPRDQVRFILRRELINRNLLAEETSSTQFTDSKKEKIHV